MNTKNNRGYTSNVDELIEQTPLDLVLTHYGLPLSNSNAQEYRMKCVFNEACGDSQYGNLAVKQDVAKQIYCHSCSVRGNLLTLIHGLETGQEPIGGKVRGQEFKNAVAKLKDIYKVGDSPSLASKPNNQPQRVEAAVSNSSIGHPTPTVENKVSRLDRSAFKELEPPPNLKRPSGPQVVTLGRVCFRNERFKFGMDLEARRRHLWILGKTGMGKSTLLKNIMRQDMERGRSFALIEPHGDLAADVLACVPKRRKNDIIYFDPADDSNRVRFNPLMVSDSSDKTLVADGVLSAFQKVFGMDESQAPRLLHIFRNSLLSLVETPNANLMDVGRILIDAPYRKSVVARVGNPAVRSFWLDEFGKWKAHDRTAFIASLQNKLGAFLTNPKLQRVLSDPKAKLDLRKAMDDGKILIVNLSKGRLGENASNLLGTLLVTSLQLAAMSRANILEDDRRDFSIIMDEFQNFATPSISTFLSEARKYRTHLIIANQYTQQIPEQILAAILGNVGSQIAFQLGTIDAQLFETQFADTVTAGNLMNIPKYHAYTRILVQGMPSSTFSFVTVVGKLMRVEN